MMNHVRRRELLLHSSAIYQNFTIITMPKSLIFDAPVNAYMTGRGQRTLFGCSKRPRHGGRGPLEQRSEH